MTVRNVEISMNHKSQLQDKLLSDEFFCLQSHVLVKK